MTYRRRYHSTSGRIRGTKRARRNNSVAWIVVLVVVVGGFIVNTAFCSHASSSSSTTANTQRGTTLSNVKSEGKQEQVSNEEYSDGGMLEKPAPINDRSEIMLFKPNFIVSYNTTTFCPNYVAWHLTLDRIEGNISRSNNFHPDESLPEEYQVTTYDYSNSGYDRGHMCPAADNKNSGEYMSNSFYMTNMCPQNRSLNAGEWNTVEALCRDWTKRHGDVYVVCGPIFDTSSPKTIGKPDRMRICVPDRFFKCVLAMGKKPMAIAFIMPNEPGNSPIRSYCVSVDQVEAITGYDFFPTLPDEIENDVEAQCNPNKWCI